MDAITDNICPRVCRVC